MGDSLRATVVPFFATLYPAVWYVNRNLTTDRLPPRIEPSTELIVAGLAVAVIGSAAVAALLAPFRVRTDDERSLRYRQRIFQPDRSALGVFGAFVAAHGLWALVGLVDVGPSWLGDALSVLLVPLALPFVLLAPLAIHFHWAVVLGLASTVLWTSLLSILVAERLFRDDRRDSRPPAG